MTKGKVVNIADARSKKRREKDGYESVYQCKVTLKWVKPQIWRRIQVPGNYTFWDLHVAIQDAMGWLGGHLHEFNYPTAPGGPPCRIGSDDDDDFSEDRGVLEERKEKIADHLREKMTVEYCYDFGDYWCHRVTVEKVMPREEGALYPRCLAGKRACPPEDCGGPHAYMEILAIWEGADTAEKEEVIEMFGDDFDPGYFDIEEIEFEDPEEVWRDRY